MTSQKEGKNKQAEVTIKSVYLSYKPLSVNSPSPSDTPTESSSEPTLTRGEFMGVLKRVSQPLGSTPKGQRDSKKS